MSVTALRQSHPAPRLLGLAAILACALLAGRYAAADDLAQIVPSPQTLPRPRPIQLPPAAMTAEQPVKPTARSFAAPFLEDFLKSDTACRRDQTVSMYGDELYRDVYKPAPKLGSPIIGLGKPEIGSLPPSHYVVAPGFVGIVNENAVPLYLRVDAVSAEEIDFLPNEIKVLKVPDALGSMAARYNLAGLDQSIVLAVASLNYVKVVAVPPHIEVVQK